MSEQDFSRADYTGKLFVRRHRLEVCRAVLKFEVEPPEPFNAKMIHEDVVAHAQLPHPTTAMVWDELGQFELLGWVERLSARQSKVVHMFRLEHEMWPVMEMAVGAMDRLYPPEASPHL